MADITSPDRRPRITGRSNRPAPGNRRVVTKTTTKTKAKSVPDWNEELYEKNLSAHRYRKISLNKDGAYVTGNLSGTGINAMFEKKNNNGVRVNQDLVYLPELRLAGKSSVIQAYLKDIVRLNKVKQSVVDDAWAHRIDHTNYTDAAVQDMVAAAKKYTLDMKGTINHVSLERLHLLYKQVNDRKITTEVKDVEKEAKTGRKGQTKPKVSVFDQIFDLADVNKDLPQGVPYKYINVNKYFDGTVSKSQGSGSSIDVLPTYFPIRGNDAANLKAVVEDLWKNVEQSADNDAAIRDILDNINSQEAELAKKQASKPRAKPRAKPRTRKAASPARRTRR